MERPSSRHQESAPLGGPHARAGKLRYFASTSRPREPNTLLAGFSFDRPFPVAEGAPGRQVSIDIS